MSKKEKVLQLFNPDVKGESKWITVEDIVKADIKWSSNGNQRHGKFFGIKEYVWEKYPEKGKILKLRMTGIDTNELNKKNRPIRKDIKDFYKKKPCVVCGSMSDLVCDHKNDLYNDIRVLNSKTQTKDDFQSLCNACNLRKRAVSVKTIKTGKRWGATNIPMFVSWGIDFIEGDETYDPTDPNALVGTYWYDPIAFIKGFPIKIIKEITKNKK